jgi:hypothetical protein
MMRDGKSSVELLEELMEGFGRVESVVCLGYCVDSIRLQAIGGFFESAHRPFGNGVCNLSVFLDDTNGLD